MTILQLLKEYPIGDRKQALYKLIIDTDIIANTLETQTQKDLADSLGVTQPFISHLAPLITKLTSSVRGTVYLRTYIGKDNLPAIDQVEVKEGMTLSSEI